jgi:hypothetical protein
VGPGAQAVEEAGAYLSRMQGCRVKGRRGTLPRASSPAGVKTRQARRAAAKPQPAKGVSKDPYKKPGSRNPRKVGR